MPGLKLRRRGGIWQAVGSVAGQRTRQSLGTRDRARAEELAALLEARLWKRHSYGEAAVRTFDDAALSYLAAGGERRFLAPLIRRFGARMLATIQPGELREAARALYPEAKPATWNRQAIAPARAVINHGAALGWCPAIRIAGFAVARPRRRAVERSWIDAFLAAADRARLPHLAAAVLFMHQTGARVSEAARVMPTDVDLAARTITLTRTKTGAFEVCHISRELMLRLANLATHPRLPLFRYASRYGIYRRMKSVCARAGIEFVPPHEAGRHSFATAALAMGASLREVMEAGRWKSAQMVLEIYAHANDGGRRVAGLFDTESAQPPSATDANPRRRKPVS